METLPLKLDLSLVKVPKTLVFFEAPTAKLVLLLNPEIGSFTVLSQDQFSTFFPAFLNWRDNISQITPSLLKLLSKLIIRKIIYYGDYVPKINDQSPEIPLSIYWETTHGCTLRCVYCYMNADTVRPGELSPQEALELIDQIANLGSKRLVFTGGEAMIRKDIFHLGSHAKARGLATEMITNATLIKDISIAQNVKETFDHVIVSLDGACPEHNDVHRGAGSFELITRGLRLLNQVGVQPLLNSVLSDANVDYVDELLDYVKESFNVKSHRVMTISKLGRGHETPHDINWSNHLKLHNARLSRARKELKNSPELLIRTIKRSDLKPTKNCGMGSGEIYIDSQGNVYPCKLITTNDWFSGNVRQSPLAEILGSPAMSKARNLSVMNLKGCRSCIIRRLCGGGCRGNHMGVSGDALQNNPEFCWQLRHQMVAQLWTVEGHIDVLDEEESIVPNQIMDGEVWKPEIGTALPTSVLSSVTRHLKKLEVNELPMA